MCQAQANHISSTLHLAFAQENTGHFIYMYHTVKYSLEIKHNAPFIQASQYRNLRELL